MKEEVTEQRMVHKGVRGVPGGHAVHVQGQESGTA